MTVTPTCGAACAGGAGSRALRAAVRPHLAPPRAWVFHAPATSAKRRNLTEGKWEAERDRALTAPLMAEQLSSDDELPHKASQARGAGSEPCVSQPVSPSAGGRDQSPGARTRTISCARKDSGQDSFISYDVCASKCTWYKYKEAFSV